HLGRIAVKDAKPLGYVGHTDSHAGGVGRRLRSRLCHSHAIILHLDGQLVVYKSAAQRNGTAIQLGREAVLDGVLDQRLEQHARNQKVKSRWLQLLDYTQLIPPEAGDLDVQIVIDELHLFAKLDEGLVLAQQTSQDAGQLHHQLARGVRIEAHQGGDG